MRLIPWIAALALCSCQNPGMTPETADAGSPPPMPSGEEAGPPGVSDGTEDGPSEAARELARKIQGDDAPADTPSEETVEKMARELFDALTSGDEKRIQEFELTTEEVGHYYTPAMAQIVSQSRAGHNSRAWNEFMATGGAEATLVGVQLADAPRRLDPKSGQVPVARPVDFVGEVRILYSVQDSGRAVILKGILHTPRGWRFLQLALN